MKIKDEKSIKTGDMPGDKVQINQEHIIKAEKILNCLLDRYGDQIKGQKNKKVVISVYGGSGVGKSEIGALLADSLNTMGISTYILSGDNYPHRIPKQNDLERERIFYDAGIKGLVESGAYRIERHDLIKKLKKEGSDAESKLSETYDWFKNYYESGKQGLREYLGTQKEIDFQEISAIIQRFKQGEPSIYLKRMGREEEIFWYDLIDFDKTNVLILEWTHGNNASLIGVDIPILLDSTPEETLEHRKKRNRDGKTDSPFTSLVLSIEQELLDSQRHKAKIIMTKKAELLEVEHEKR